MTQEQVRELVNRMMSEKDPRVLLYILTAAIFSLIVAAGLAYLKKRAEDLATQKSLSEITHTVESIKSTYGKEIETLRAFLGTKSHFSRLRYEREIEVYKELWAALVELGEATLLLRPFVDMVPSNETEDQRKARKGEAFIDKQRRVHGIVTKNRPFYPSEIWQELVALLKLTKEEFVEFQFIGPFHRDPTKANEYIDKAAKNQAEISERINDICEAIRLRLDKFDGPDSLA